MKIIIICGATATGKSRLAIHLAKELNSEIINFDSQQVYQDFNIGTAKPSDDELQEIKHHLIGNVDPRKPYTAGDFRRDSLSILNDLSKKSEYAILVGGTGFYLQALLNGMFEAPPSNPLVKKQLLDRLEKNGLASLHDELKISDSKTAEKINPNDQYRILRALEIIITEGKTLTEIRKSFRPEQFLYPYLKIGVRRTKSLLREAVSQRSKNMLELGLLDEVSGIFEKYGREVKPLSAVGYKEAVEYLKNRDSRFPATHKELIQLAEKITASTMQLAKRQSTWFKRDADIYWVDPDVSDIKSEVLTKIQKF